MSREGIACIGHTFGNFRVYIKWGFEVCDLAICDFELRMVLPESIQNGYWFAKRKDKDQMGRFGIG